MTGGLPPLGGRSRASFCRQGAGAFGANESERDGLRDDGTRATRWTDMNQAVPPSVIERKRAQPFYLQLWFLVLVAMVLGIALGHFYPNAGVRMELFGDAFIKAIRFLIAPIIFCTVVQGIASMADMRKVGRVAIKAIVYFEIMTTIA